jgi:hypothetical protein
LLRPLDSAVCARADQEEDNAFVLAPLAAYCTTISAVGQESINAYVLSSSRVGYYMVGVFLMTVPCANGGMQQQAVE